MRFPRGPCKSEARSRTNTKQIPRGDLSPVVTSPGSGFQLWFSHHPSWGLFTCYSTSLCLSCLLYKVRLDRCQMLRLMSALGRAPKPWAVTFVICAYARS